MVFVSGRKANLCEEGQEAQETQKCAEHEEKRQ